MKPVRGDILAPTDVNKGAFKVLLRKAVPAEASTPEDKISDGYASPESTALAAPNSFLCCLYGCRLYN